MHEKPSLEHMQQEPSNCRMLRFLHPGALCRFSLTPSAFSGAQGVAILPPTSLPATLISLPFSSFTVSPPKTPSKCSLPYHHPASTNLAVTATVIFPSIRPLSTSPLWRHGHDEDKVSSCEVHGSQSWSCVLRVLELFQSPSFSKMEQRWLPWPGRGRLP